MRDWCIALRQQFNQKPLSTVGNRSTFISRCLAPTPLFILETATVMARVVSGRPLCTCPVSRRSVSLRLGGGIFGRENFKPGFKFWRQNASNEASAASGDVGTVDSGNGVLENQSWTWRGHDINYVVAGEGQPVLLVHGFGASTGHFRKNIPVLAENYKVYAIDLLGFGASAKAPVDYSMELWRDLIVDFTDSFIDRPVVIVGNSIGSLATLMVGASMSDDKVKGLVLLNCAGAMNNKSLVDDWRVVVAYPFFALIDAMLKTPPIARFLFNNVAKKDNIKSVLSGVYGNQDAVDDELVDIIYGPSQDEGALEVFVSVITGPPGPRPETVVENVKSPLLLLWGKSDPFSPIDGPVAKSFKSLTESRPGTKFVELEGVGHCPHDDRPDLVHEQLLPWLSEITSKN